MRIFDLEVPLPASLLLAPLLTFCFVLLFTFTIYFHLCFVFAHLLYLSTLLLQTCNPLCTLTLIFTFTASTLTTHEI